jgi:hypothetical protein
MKLTNSTSWPDTFLRRMVTWCREQIGLPARCVKAARFGATHRGFSGRAYLQSFRIGVRVGCRERFPTHFRVPGVDAADEWPRILNDREEALVKVTAHELCHLDNYRLGDKTRGRNGCGGSEGWTQRQAEKVLFAFRADRERLLAEWSAAAELVAADTPPRPSIVEKRAAKAAADLSRWQRKLRLAQTKVKKLKARVAYYTKRQTP